MATLKQTTINGDLFVGEQIKLSNSIETTATRVNFFSTKSTIHVGQYAPIINLLGQNNSKSSLTAVGTDLLHGPTINFNSLDTNVSSGGKIGEINFQTRFSSNNSNVGTKISIYSKYIDSNNSSIHIGIFNKNNNILEDNLTIGETYNNLKHVKIKKDLRLESTLTVPTSTYGSGTEHKFIIGKKELVPKSGTYRLSTANNFLGSLPSSSDVAINWSNASDNNLKITYTDTDTYGGPWYHFTNKTYFTYPDGSSYDGPMPEHYKCESVLTIPGGLYVNYGGASVSTNNLDGQLKLYQSSDNFKSGIKFFSPKSTNYVEGIVVFVDSSNRMCWHTIDSGYNGNYTQNPTNSLKGYIITTASARLVNFTGQHRVIKAQADEWQVENIGKIVISNGKYINFDSSSTININEALPEIKLSSERKQKNVFGVISSEDEAEAREFAVGAFVTVYSEQDTENTRVVVNSIGEGAVWVCNVNGNFENGDYITTCEIPGYGMNQQEDFLSNYTVAKITCDCDFNLTNQNYICEEFEWEGEIYRRAFVGCTYHCG